MAEISQTTFQKRVKKDICILMNIWLNYASMNSLGN